MLARKKERKKNRISDVAWCGCLALIFFHVVHFFPIVSKESILIKTHTHIDSNTRFISSSSNSCWINSYNNKPNHLKLFIQQQLTQNQTKIHSFSSSPLFVFKQQQVLIWRQKRVFGSQTKSKSKVWSSKGLILDFGSQTKNEKVLYWN